MNTTRLIVDYQSCLYSRCDGDHPDCMIETAVGAVKSGSRVGFSRRELIFDDFPEQWWGTVVGRLHGMDFDLNVRLFERSGDSNCLKLLRRVSIVCGTEGVSMR